MKILSYSRLYFQLLLGLVLLMTSCQVKEDPIYQIIEIGGVEEFYNYSTSSFAYVLELDSAASTAMLAAKGDLIVISDDYFFHDGQLSYNFKVDDGVVYNNGKVFSFSISNKPFVEVLKNNTDAIDLTQLDHIILDKNLPKDAADLIEIIAAKNQSIGVIVQDWSEEVKPLLKSLNIDWLSVKHFNLEGLNSLAGVSGIQYLMLSEPTAELSDAMVNFPDLEVLVLDEFRLKSSVSEKFLSKNKQIKKLTIGNSKVLNFSFLQELQELNSLTFQLDSAIDLSFIAELSKLKRIGVLADQVENWTALKEQKNIRWLLVSNNIGQDEFENLIGVSQDLNVLELIFCDSIIVC